MKNFSEWLCSEVSLENCKLGENLKTYIDGLDSIDDLIDSLDDLTNTLDDMVEEQEVYRKAMNDMFACYDFDEVNEPPIDPITDTPIGYQRLPDDYKREFMFDIVVNHKGQRYVPNDYDLKYDVDPLFKNRRLEEFERYEDDKLKVYGESLADEKPSETHSPKIIYVKLRTSQQIETYKTQKKLLEQRGLIEDERRDLYEIAKLVVGKSSKYELQKPNVEEEQLVKGFNIINCVCEIEIIKP